MTLLPFYPWRFRFQKDQISFTSFALNALDADLLNQYLLQYPFPLSF